MPRLSSWYIIFPMIAMIAVMPMVFSLPPFLPAGTTNKNAFQIIIVIPFYLGLISSPGYLYAWSGHYNAKCLSSIQKWWIGSSLVGALIASLTGLISVFTIINIPFIAGSVGVTSLLCLRFFKSF